MANEHQYVVVTTTVDNEEAAQLITDALLEPRLAACVQATAIQSAFWWKGEIVRADEVRLQAKTPADNTEALIAAIRAVHPYETPEIVVTPILSGNPSYLKWIEEETVEPGQPHA
jgi:periplasmic divalent cation tolerance protein